MLREALKKEAAPYQPKFNIECVYAQGDKMQAITPVTKVMEAGETEVKHEAG